MKNLKIYKASAGSGKTHKLVEEYIRLVFADADNYQRILAITFTNKATEEMKSRILYELYHLSQGKETSHYKALMQHYKFLDKERLVNRAKLILKRILYDYSNFEISTIDSFFQKVLRNFAREIGFQLGYNIELDTSRILAMAVDLLIMDIENNKDLANWLIRFAREKIEDGKSWNLKRNIEGFAREVFKENFQRFEKKIQAKIEDKKFLLKFRNKLIKIKTTFESGMSEIGKTALSVMEKNGLTIMDFSFGASGIGGYFEKISSKTSFQPGQRVYAAKDDPSKWYTAKTSQEIKDKISNIITSDLSGLLIKAIDLFNAKYIEYNSAIAVLRYFNVLGILTDISSKLSQIRESENLMLISDINPFLNDIVRTNDTPFIYEKIGARYDHFMIDEFQDTSAFQWNNLKPLVKNSLADNNFNMLVGDVKQSIYRWRGGDWKLLLKGINEDVAKEQIEEINLDYNWRSGENIVAFNNSFFYRASQQLQTHFNNTIEEIEDEELSADLSGYKDILLKAYRDCYQRLPEGQEKISGKVEVRFYEKEDPRSPGSWKPEIKEELPLIVDELLTKKFKQGDITILVRTIKDGREIAEILLNKNKYNIISRDSLFLAASPAIRLITSVFRYLYNAQDKINLANLIHEYQVYLPENSGRVKDPNDLFFLNNSENEIVKLLPKELIERRSYLRSQDLNTLAESIITIFNLNQRKEELAFLQAFGDAVLTYSQKNKPDLGSFISWWEEDGKSISIKLPDNHDAIQIMTIHHAKGLDFKAVIIPYCDWRLDHNPGFDNILWCSEAEETFDDLTPLPVKYGSSLETTIFRKEYFVEKLHAIMDNLNLLYVSFTRPIEALYILGPQPSKELSLNNVSDLLYLILSDVSKSKMIIDPTADPVKEIESLFTFWNEDKMIFKKGELSDQTQDVDEEKKSSLYVMENYFSNIGETGITVKKNAEHVFDDSKDIIPPKVKYGTFMHEVLSKIKTSEDIEKQVNELFFEGKLTADEKDKLQEKLIDIVNYEKARDWFEDDWEIKTEIPIIDIDGDMKIPDRVLIKDKKAIVIDFKFGQESDDHKWQVRGYMDKLSEMGYEQVEGFVYYAESAKIIKIK